MPLEGWGEHVQVEAERPVSGLRGRAFLLGGRKADKTVLNS